MNTPSLTIIVPVFNEEKCLPNVLPDIIKFCNQKGFDLVVINDGSTDETKNILSLFEDKCFQVIHHKLNNGYGGAIKSGILASKTEYSITIDADGQHYLADVDKLYKKILEKDADMVVGSRKGKSSFHFRRFGKWIIRRLAKFLMPIPIHDINSGMKICRTELLKKYIHLCPNTMAFSDIIALVFISNNHLVLEEPIRIRKRLVGKSTIRIQTAFQTIIEILNIMVLFNPLKIFLPISLLFFIAGILWGLQFILNHKGVSIGSSLLIIMSFLTFLLGLIAEQLSAIRKNIMPK